MKAMKLLAVVLTICMAFSCIAVIPFTAATVASADATPSATATTKAIYVGPSTVGYDAITSCAIFPVLWTGKYASNTKLEFTAKVKMLNGTKPYLTFYRCRTYKGTYGNYISWCDNANSYIDGDGVFNFQVRH